MNKFLRKVIVLAMTGSMIAGTAATVSAADSSSSGLNTNNTVSADTSSINLIKNYTLGTVNYDGAKSPEETFEFTIEPYGVWNAGSSTGAAGGDAYSTSNMPALAKKSTNTGNSEYTVKVEAKQNQSNVNKVTIHAIAGYAGNNSPISEARLDLNDFNSVGDFWYKVTETDNNVAGVIYGTNDNAKEDFSKSNNDHNAVYYIHVQVTNQASQGYYRTVTLHKTAPDAAVKTNAQYEKWNKNNYSNSPEQTDKKVNDIQNKYYAGSLKITKKVTGNTGDKNKLFKIIVVLKNDSGANMNSDITYSNFYDDKGKLTPNAKSIDWTDTLTNDSNNTITHSDARKEVTFYVKDNTTVTFNNIPYGVSYTVSEEQPKDDTYTHIFAYTENTMNNSESTFNGVKTVADTVYVEKEDTGENASTTNWDAAKATGSISDASDEITITNHKESTIDVGVITSNAPYIAMLILAAAAAFVFIRRRRDLIEE